jgi:hypothetical protein
MNDAVALTHREGLTVLPEQSFSREYEEDLLIGAVLVRGGREISLGNLDTPQTHGT